MDQSERPPAPPVVVYAARDAASMRSVFDAYTSDTGISVALTTESDRALIDRLSAEKHRSTADLVITDGIGNLWNAVERDILRPSNSELLGSKVPESLRDPEDLWIVLLVFGRTIAYDRRLIDPGELSGYDALGDKRWRDSLCLSTAADVDNQAHVAMMIAEHGDRPAELIVRSWIANLAMPVVTDGARLLQEIEAGRCSLGIAGSDDVARHTRDNPDTGVGIFWPPASSGGAYINVVGAAVTRHAGNPPGALKLLEWLASEKGQEALTTETLEYPVSQGLPLEAVSSINLAGAGYYQEDAVNLMERARWRN